MNNTKVLIIGAGPVGLTLACDLARRKIPFRIIERLTNPAIGSRAKGVQPRSLEVLDDFNITPKLMQYGYTDLPYRKYNYNQLVGEAPRKVFSRTDTRYPGILLLPQYQVEEALRSKLAEAGVQIEWATELADFTQTEDGIICRLENPNWTEEVNCTYLVGCDGGKSETRKKLNIKFIGTTHQEEQAWVGDVEVEGLNPDAWYNWFSPEFGFSFALFPFKNSNNWQLQAAMPPDADGHVPTPTLEGFNKLFQERTGMAGVRFTNSSWQSIYRVNVRIAEQYRIGNAFIAGDACHVHPIAGGMGMNTGIQDAYNLSWKLAAVIKGYANDRLLDTYAEERIPIAEGLLKTTSMHHQNLVNATKTGNGGLESIAAADNTQLNLRYRDSSLTVKTNPLTNGLQSGDRAPNVQLTADRWLSNDLSGPEWKLIVPDNARVIKNQNLKVVKTNNQAVINAYGLMNGGALIRPDGYIAMLGADKAAIDKYFGQLNRGK